MNSNYQVIIDLKLTGDRIRTLRVSNGIKVSHLQEIFGFSTSQAIYKWEQGKCLPTIDNLLILSKIFKVSMENILVYTFIKV